MGSTKHGDFQGSCNTYAIFKQSYTKQIVTANQSTHFVSESAGNIGLLSMRPISLIVMRQDSPFYEPVH